MQFVPHGPDIPDALLQAQDEGRVVFFCGVGIFYFAGLPGFKGLGEQIYQQNGTDLSEIVREVFECGQFDATLDLLERRLPGQHLAVCRALAKALKPNLRLKGLPIYRLHCCGWRVAARMRCVWLPPTSTVCFMRWPNARAKHSRPMPLRCYLFRRTTSGLSTRPAARESRRHGSEPFCGHQW